MALILLSLLSFSLNSQALSGQNSQGGDRSDAIILPSLQWGILKSVRPILDIGEHSFAGPADMWEPDYGFLVQSTDPASYALNFPTTGANGLYFDFIIMGEASELTWGAPVTHEGITATVTRKRECNNEGYVEFRVTLTGPEARTQWRDPYPNQITVPRLPQTFELVGRDSNDNEVVRYGFVLRQWFVNRGRPWSWTFPEVLAWCNSLGYRMSRVRDLTNSNYHNLGATPSSSVNHYTRHIGAGFLSEWGYVNWYTGNSDFADNLYWATDATGSNSFLIYSLNGQVLTPSSSSGRSGNYGVCTAP
ncbi:hypothetical protein [Gilliamella sp. Pas-s25]|uniref:hypothetical protein n=1 Tax=Gilliamella sp. Pas-s25 TaxID=2687310 RepID=UPI00135E2BCF|nr:hypothetical protein [Gilliamella sp. Pas-s25]MWP62505.1 hypothetical protein [Gilliamella sp. Pas-s25]